MSQEEVFDSFYRTTRSEVAGRTAEVTSAHSESKPLDLSVWRIVNHDLQADDFTMLVRRAGQRLEELP